MQQVTVCAVNCGSLDDGFALTVKRLDDAVCRTAECVVEQHLVKSFVVGPQVGKHTLHVLYSARIRKRNRTGTCYTVQHFVELRICRGQSVIVRIRNTVQTHTFFSHATEYARLVEIPIVFFKQVNVVKNAVYSVIKGDAVVFAVFRGKILLPGRLKFAFDSTFVGSRSERRRIRTLDNVGNVGKFAFVDKRIVVDHFGKVHVVLQRIVFDRITAHLLVADGIDVHARFVTELGVCIQCFELRLGLLDPVSTDAAVIGSNVKYQFTAFYSVVQFLISATAVTCDKHSRQCRKQQHSKQNKCNSFCFHFDASVTMLKQSSKPSVCSNCFCLFTTFERFCTESVYFVALAKSSTITSFTSNGSSLVTCITFVSPACTST